MNVKEVGELSQYLDGRVGQTQGLADWCQEINSQGLLRRKLTRRELAFILNRHIKNYLQVEHISTPSQYTFFRIN